MALIWQIWRSPIDEPAAQVAAYYTASDVPGFSGREAAGQFNLRLYQVNPLAKRQVALVAQLNGFLGADGLFMRTSPSLILNTGEVSFEDFFNSLKKLIDLYPDACGLLSPLRDLAEEAGSGYGLRMFMFPTEEEEKREVAVAASSGDNPDVIGVLKIVYGAFTRNGFEPAGFCGFVSAECFLDRTVVLSRIQRFLLPSFRLENLSTLGTLPEIEIPDSGEIRFSPKGEEEVTMRLSFDGPYLTTSVSPWPLNLSQAGLVGDFRLRLLSILWPTVVPLPSKKLEIRLV